jgi:hypothetical protein
VLGRIYRREPKKWRITSRVISFLRRRVSRTNALLNAIPREPVYSTLEMDTHADTCVLGPNFIILHFTRRECDVSPYTEVHESVKAVPIVSGATAWKDEGTGLTYISPVELIESRIPGPVAKCVAVVSTEPRTQNYKVPFGSHL